MPVSVKLETDYPFRDTLRFTVTAEQPVTFPLWLRIPAWTTSDATVRVAGWRDRPSRGGDVPPHRARVVRARPRSSSRCRWCLSCGAATTTPSPSRAGRWSTRSRWARTGVASTRTSPTASCPTPTGRLPDDAVELCAGGGRGDAGGRYQLCEHPVGEMSFSQEACLFRRPVPGFGDSQGQARSGVGDGARLCRRRAAKPRDLVRAVGDVDVDSVWVYKSAHHGISGVGSRDRRALRGVDGRQ